MIERFTALSTPDVVELCVKYSSAFVAAAIGVSQAAISADVGNP